MAPPQSGIVPKSCSPRSQLSNDTLIELSFLALFTQAQKEEKSPIFEIIARIPETWKRFIDPDSGTGGCIEAKMK